MCKSFDKTWISNILTEEFEKLTASLANLEQTFRVIKLQIGHRKNTLQVVVQEHLSVTGGFYVIKIMDVTQADDSEPVCVNASAAWAQAQKQGPKTGPKKREIGEKFNASLNI